MTTSQRSLNSLAAVLNTIDTSPRSEAGRRGHSGLSAEERIARRTEDQKIGGNHHEVCRGVTCTYPVPQDIWDGRLAAGARIMGQIEVTNAP